MSDIKYIAQEEGGSGRGEGPEEDRIYPQTIAKQQGLVAFAFGLALGLTIVVLYLILRIPTLPASMAGLLPTFWGSVILTIVVYFVGGVIIGLLISIIYNLLINKRFNLFA